MRSSEGENLVDLCDQYCEFWRRDPCSAEFRKVIVGRPTGDCATLSDVDGQLVLLDLGYQLPHRGDPYTFKGF